MTAQAGPDLTRLSSGSSESIQRVLASIRSYLGMDVAFVSEFAPPHKIFRQVDCSTPAGPVHTGQVVTVAEGYCQHVVEGRLPELILDASQLPAAAAIPETQSIPIGSHLSVPIRLKNGRIFGTFCSFSYAPLTSIGHRELDLMHTFARLVALQIDGEIEKTEMLVAKAVRINEALANGDPHIVFQPICRLSDGQVTGVEALSRFHTEPIRTPDLWFDDASQVGQSEMLELLAIRKAIAAAGDLPAELALSVNVSPDVVINGHLSPVLDEFDPTRLAVEITEHSMIRDYQALIDALAPLRARGVKVAIDDAGAGYASLRHVLMLRPDVIKFDISITRGIDTDPMRRALAAALSEFARHTETAIVAEGVETSAELQVLNNLGIDKGQGYFFSRPLPPDELVRLLSADRATTAPRDA